MNRAGLSAVPAGELLQDAVRPVEDPPEALNRIAVVGNVLAIGRKGCRHGQALRRLADGHVDAEPGEDCIELFVELGHGESIGELE